MILAVFRLFSRFSTAFYTTFAKKKNQRSLSIAGIMAFRRHGYAVFLQGQKIRIIALRHKARLAVLRLVDLAGERVFDERLVGLIVTVRGSSVRFESTPSGFSP